MKKNILFTVLLIITILSLKAQTAPAIQWQKSLGGSGYDYAYAVSSTTDGGYIVAGAAASNDGDITGNHGPDDYWIIKFDASGNVQWKKCYGGSDDDEPNSIEQTTDGGYIVAGSSASVDGDVTGNHGPYDYWILKIDNTGTIQWQTSLGGSGDDEVSGSDCIKQTSDGGYIVAGQSASADGDVTGNHGNYDYWVVKLTNSGAIQWQKSYGGSNEDDATSIRQTPDGGYIIGGSSFSNDGDVTGHHGPAGSSPDYWIVKIDGTGTIQWQKSFGGSGSDYCNSIATTSDGGYVLTGLTGSNDGDVSSNHGSSDYWIVKLDNTGTIQWQKSLGGSGDDIGTSIQQTPDGGYIACGGSSSDDGDVTGNHSSGFDVFDVWVIKLSNTGIVQWQKCLGGSASDVAHSIKVTNDHGYIIAGYSFSNDGDLTANNGNEDCWIVKLTPDALLPVSLLNFYGEVNGKQNILHWSTATEENNTGFEIQRSTDGNNFSKIGFINSEAANGNSNTKLNYNYTDASFSTDNNFYRLKQIDKDGKFSYSNIIELKNDHTPAIATMEVYPNPATNLLNIKLTSSNNNGSKLIVTDISGKTILSQSAIISNGETHIQIDISHFTAGIYIIKLMTANGSEKNVKKFIKQ